MGLFDFFGRKKKHYNYGRSENKSADSLFPDDKPTKESSMESNREPLALAESDNSPQNVKSKPFSLSGAGVSQSADQLAISQYSKFPRYYIIDGVKYDIDNPDDIKRIPLIKNIISINGEQYGMDSLLNEHCMQSTANMDVHWAAYNKVKEYRDNGIIHYSQSELSRKQEHELGQIERKRKEDARKKQCDSFTIDDMQQFSDIPFAWHYVMHLNHTNGISWIQLNKNNREIALYYISQVNDIIVDSQGYIDGIGNAHIDLDEIDFDYPNPTQIDSMCNTRVECYPYSASGKLSKYPVIIHFETKWKKTSIGSDIRSSGEIKILRDGNIGMATVNINGSIFKIGLHGVSLVLKRVDNPYMGGNLYKFSEMID